MNTTGLLGTGILILVGALMALFTFLHKRSPFSFRNIQAYTRIRRAASIVVEDGTRLHVSLGNGNLLTTAGASALAGLALLRRLGKTTSLSDNPPISTSGNPLINLAAEETLRMAHESVAVDQSFNPNNARLTGLTPLSYAAGVMPAIRDEQVSTNILIGSFGPEVGLLTEAADRQNTTVIAASDSIPAQAVLYATSNEPLIGEELFAAGAYTQSGDRFSAGLVTQDVLRWLLIIALLAGAALKLVGIL